MNLDEFKTLEQLAASIKTLLLEDMMANKGWINSAWQKDPLRLGYSGDQTESKSNLSTSAGDNSLTSTAVPAGEIWILQAVDAVNNDTDPSRVLIFFSANSINITLHTQTSPGAAIAVYWKGEIVLSEGDTINALFSGCSLNDDIYMRYHAVRVDIDQ